VFFHSLSVFMFTVYCLMDPCGLISNKEDEEEEEDTMDDNEGVLTFVVGLINIQNISLYTC